MAGDVCFLLISHLLIISTDSRLCGKPLQRFETWEVKTISQKILIEAWLKEAYTNSVERTGACTAPIKKVTAGKHTLWISLGARGSLKQHQRRQRELMMASIGIHLSREYGSSRKKCGTGIWHGWSSPMALDWFRGATTNISAPIPRASLSQPKCKFTRVSVHHLKPAPS
jgi:hypothetical protein